ncbi:MAG: hypothetical protein P1V34_11655 [Alphaproteobacteria bacterium]|nr:hypothetical protein [Alphaproteobacteria bacterium]
MSEAPPKIADLVPHDGLMVLLEDVLHWDQSGVLCRTKTHNRTENPLRRDDQLPALAGIEYGAQAAAVHGALLGQKAGGYLVSVKDCQIKTRLLSDHPGPLLVSANRVMATQDAFIYRIAIQEETAAPLDTDLLVGQITIMLT